MKVKLAAWVFSRMGRSPDPADNRNEWAGDRFAPAGGDGWVHRRSAPSGRCCRQCRRQLLNRPQGADSGRCAGLLGSLSQVEHNTNDVVAKAATGGDVDVHDVMIASRPSRSPFRLRCRCATSWWKRIKTSSACRYRRWYGQRQRCPHSRTSPLARLRRHRNAPGRGGSLQRCRDSLSTGSSDSTRPGGNGSKAASVDPLTYILGLVGMLTASASQSVPPASGSTLPDAPQSTAGEGQTTQLPLESGRSFRRGRERRLPGRFGGFTADHGRRWRITPEPASPYFTNTLLLSRRDPVDGASAVPAQGQPASSGGAGFVAQPGPTAAPRPSPGLELGAESQHPSMIAPTVSTASHGSPLLPAVQAGPLGGGFQQAGDAPTAPPLGTAGSPAPWAVLTPVPSSGAPSKTWRRRDRIRRRHLWTCRAETQVSSP